MPGKIIKNGGFEQEILEAVNENYLLNEADKKHSLPQDRLKLIESWREYYEEITTTHKI